MNPVEAALDPNPVQPDWQRSLAQITRKKRILCLIVPGINKINADKLL